MDATRRELERRVPASGDVGDRARLMQLALREGRVTPDAITLAASLGDPAAALVMPGVARAYDVPVERLGALTTLPGLTNLELRCMSTTDEELAQLADHGLTALTHLGASGGEGFTDAGLAQLGRLTGLTHLDLDLDLGTPDRWGPLPAPPGRITETGLASLGSLESLVYLKLTLPDDVDDAALSFLAHLERLEELELVARPITDDVVIHLTRSQLRSLEAQLSDRGLEAVSRIRTLEDLRVTTRPHLTRAGFARLFDLPALSDVTIVGGADVREVDVVRLVALRPTLGELSWGLARERDAMVRLGDHDLAELAGLPGLQQLDLTKCTGFTAEGLAHLARARGLERLFLSWCTQLEDAALAHLRNLPLAEVRLDHCDWLTDEGLAHLAALPLERLDLTGCSRVTDRGLAHLAALPLERLDLTGCSRVTDRGIERLASLPLTSLRLGDCHQVTDAGVARLGSVGSLTELWLQNCPAITDQGLGHLRTLSRLDVLDLGGLPLISAEAVSDLRSAFPSLRVWTYGCARIDCAKAEERSARDEPVTG